jgi:hypothetical protein
MKQKVRYVLLGLLLVLVVGQIAPYPPAENPPVGEEVSAPPEVRRILQTSCYDCHSNETVWPWYSFVVPAKWLVRHDVVEGRGHLNFSTWGEYSGGEASHRLEEVVEMVQEGEMPLGTYVLMHRDAALSQADADRLVEWARNLGNLTEDEGGNH